jgi:hypothetical protein
MSARRYQLTVSGYGDLIGRGSHNLRLTPHTSFSGVEDNIRCLFDLPAGIRIKCFEETEGQNGPVAVSLAEVVQGVLDYFQNDMDDSFLVTDSASLLVDACVTVTHAAVSTSNATGKTSSGDSRTKSGNNYSPKPWSRQLDSLWPFAIPRCGIAANATLVCSVL